MTTIRTNITPRCKESSGELAEYRFASTGEIIDLEGYTPYSEVPSSLPTILASDTLNIAVQKIDGAIKVLNRDKAALSHTHASSDINILTGYVKADTAGEITATDTLNEALGKVQKTLDGKQASGNYLTPSSSLDATKLTGTIPTACYTDTTYDNFVGSGSTAAAGLVPSPGTTAGTSKYLREDATWQVPPDTVYTHPTTSGNKHIPSGGSANQILRYSADGTAVWDDESDTIYTASNGITLTGNNFTNSGVRGVATGATNGTISVNTNGTSAEVSVYGLGSAAFTDSDAYAANNHTHTPAEIGAAEDEHLHSVDDIVDFPTIPTISDTYSGTSTDGMSGIAVKSAIDSALTSAYKPAGSIAFASLPTLSSSVFGNVYNITDSFTIDNRFVEYDSGETKTYPAGSEVAVIDAGTVGSPSYKFSVMSGFIDLSDYQLSSTAVKHTASTAVGSGTQPVYVDSNGNAVATTYTLGKSVPSDAVFTDTTYNDFVGSGSSAAAGLVPSPGTIAGTTKYLREDGTWEVPPDTKYIHPTTSGNKHIPSGGLTGQILKYESDGTAVWANETTYDTFVKSGVNASGGLVPSPGTTAGTSKYLREDATWEVPPDTVYTHPTTSGNKHIPSGGSANQILRYSADGTAVWDDETTYSTFNASGADATGGLVPSPGTTAGSSKYLREDATWQVPPNDIYTHPTTSGYKHIPSGGSANQILRYTADGTAAWSNETAYNPFIKSGTSAAAGLVPKPDTTAGTTKYLREDATWQVPPDHTYSEFVQSGSSAASGLVPSPGTTAGISKYLREDATWQVPPDTTYDVFVGSGSTAAAGLVPAPGSTAGTTKYLREDGTWEVPPDTVYTHPTTSGNKHIPSGGSSDQILRYSADGTAVWDDETTYNTFTASGSGATGGLVPSPGTTSGTTKYLREDATWAVPPGHDYSDFIGSGATAASGLVPAPSTTAGTTKYLREDATWQVPPDHTYSNFVASGSSASAGLVPSPGSTAGSSKYLREDATWAVPPDHTYSNFVGSGATAAAGLVPAPSATAGATKYLREDATWQVPPDHTYSNFVKSGTGAAAGLVPSPGTTAGTTKYLREDATWAVPPDTDTTYTAGDGLTLNGTQFKHSNAINAGTVGTNSATSGSSLSVPYVTYDAQGHITATGTHTHTVTGFTPLAASVGSNTKFIYTDANGALTASTFEIWVTDT